MDREPLVKNFDNSSMFTTKFIVLLFAVVVVGLLTGYVLATQTSFSPGDKLKAAVEKGSISKGTVEGLEDTKTFKDTVSGKLKEGGLDGEGAFHLERPGGESQNVYLTSSTVDLSKYVDREIKVWGETQKAQKAGWLMDVGRIEVLK